MRTQAEDWSGQRERGGAFLLRVMLWITLRLGWHAGNALLYPISACFYATSPVVRAASRDFLGRVLGRPASRLDVFRHMLTFARATLDRVFLLADRGERFRVEVRGLEHLAALVAEGRGCVLLGAHLGSFEVLRTVARDCPVPVRPLMFRRNAGALTQVLERVNPAVHADIIDIGTPAAMLRAQEAVARGEMVGILADRAPGNQKAVAVPFMGEPAAFPAGPLVLAAALAAPTLLFFGVRTGHRRYLVQIEPFADPVRLRRETRQADIQDWLGRYAARLETQARAHPFNWFNFYPFWKDPADAVPRPTPPAIPAAHPPAARFPALGRLARGGTGGAFPS